MPTAISLEEAEPYVNRMRHIMRGFPEVVTVVSQHGRPDDGTDATGFFNAEFFVPLKPSGTWPRGVDKERLTEQMNRQLARRNSPASTSTSRSTSRTTSRKRRPA